MDDETDTTSLAARWFVPAAHGDDGALDALADLAMAGDWVAGWALQTAIELRAGGLRAGDSAGVSELASLSPDAAWRLEQAVRGLVEGGG